MKNGEKICFKNISQTNSKDAIYGLHNLLSLISSNTRTRLACSLIKMSVFNNFYIYNYLYIVC